jgi:hypothetical protein
MTYRKSATRSLGRVAILMSALFASLVIGGILLLRSSEWGSTSSPSDWWGLVNWCAKGGRWAYREPPVVIPSPSLALEVEAVGEDALAFSAKAYNIGHCPKPVSHVWFRAVVAFCPDEGGHEDVWVHEFDEPENVIEVKCGIYINMTLSKHAIPVSRRGDYFVSVEVRQDVRMQKMDGSIEETSMEAYGGKSVNVGPLPPAEE